MGGKDSSSTFNPAAVEEICYENPEENACEGPETFGGSHTQDLPRSEVINPDPNMCGPDAPSPVSYEEWMEGRVNCEEQLNWDGDGNLYGGCSPLSRSEIISDLKGMTENLGGAIGSMTSDGNLRQTHENIQTGRELGNLVERAGETLAPTTAGVKPVKPAGVEPTE